MSSRETWAAGVALSLMAVLAVVWWAPTGVREAPSWAAQTLEGHTVTAQELRGRPVLITFWATSCPACIQEIPQLIALYRDFNSRGLEIVGVAMAYDPPERVKALVQRYRLPYPIVLDSQGHIARAFDQVRLTPTNVLISPEGKIKHYRLGPLDIPKLRDLVEEML